MRPKKPERTGEGDLFRARLDQIINLKHELVQLGAKIDWDWIDHDDSNSAGGCFISKRVPRVSWNETVKQGYLDT
jgi:hypothetical protein